MTTADYQTLLAQAEEELGKTPGAYCSRKVAVRAMELLREAGQKEVDEINEKARHALHKATSELNITVGGQRMRIEKQDEIIERQAQAIKELQSKGLQGMQGPPGGRYAMGVDPINKRQKAALIWEEPFGDVKKYLDSSFKDARQL